MSSKKSSRPKIGLALGSGGSRGMAHIGVIKAFVENDISIDYIAGTSVGALVGGLYAAFNSTDKLDELVNELNYRDLAKIFFDPNLSFDALIRGNKATNYLSNLLGQINIENLLTPFSAVSTDIHSGQTHIFSHGSLVTAIRASISIPIVFSPFKFNESSFVDGGTSQPVPVATVKNMGADIVVAVNLYENLFPRPSSTGINLSLENILSSSVYLLLYHLSKANSAAADYTINPQGQNINPFDFILAKKLIDVGFQSALPIIKEIKSKLT